MTFTTHKTQRGWQVRVAKKPQRLPSGWVTPTTIYCETPCREFAQHITDALNAMDERKKQCQAS